MEEYVRVMKKSMGSIPKDTYKESMFETRQMKIISNYLQIAYTSVHDKEMDFVYKLNSHPLYVFL